MDEITFLLLATYAVGVIYMFLTLSLRLACPPGRYGISHRRKAALTADITCERFLYRVFLWPLRVLLQVLRPRGAAASD